MIMGTDRRFMLYYISNTERFITSLSGTLPEILIQYGWLLRTGDLSHQTGIKSVGKPPKAHTPCTLATW